MRRYLLSYFAFASLFLSTGLAQSPSSSHLLLRNPTISKTQIVFEYASSLWTVPRAGGEARRLTSGIGREATPHFSPDGSLIAFTGDYDGNASIYVIPAAGGIPRRLTYHPGGDSLAGWSPDGKAVLFSSRRQSPSDSSQLYTLPLDAALPVALSLPMAEDGAFSPDASHIAYSPVFHWQRAWKRYNGGQTLKIWLANLADSSVTELPRQGSNDFNPMWIGGKIYFLSDRKGPISLFAYDVASKSVSELLNNSNGLDLKSASATSDAIVYEQFGALHLLDLASGQSHRIPITVSTDLAEVRPHFAKIKNTDINNAALSPTGQRAVFETHGDILTVPADKGDIRNLTNSTATADRDPAWSPDGKSIAYFSDESGEYALHIRDQSGLGTVTKIALGFPPSFFYTPTWAPDNKHIAYYDKRLNLWYVDIDKKTPVKIDTDLYDSPAYDFRPNWSPDSKWIAYARQLHNNLHGIFVYSLDSAKVSQITDGLSDATAPAFDKSGKYLFFCASTNVALSGGWIDMTSIGHPVTSAVYLAVLRKDLPSPLVPLSDEEKKDEADKDKDKEKDKDKKEKEPVKVTIDFNNIQQRIIAVPLPEKNYYAVLPGKENILFAVDSPLIQTSFPNPLSVTKFDFKTRKTDPIVSGVFFFTLSDNGEKMLIRQGEQWIIAASESAPKPGEDILKMADMQVYVDPRAEWKQMYHEVWRIERDFLYDPHAHGLNLEAAEGFYSPWVDAVGSRDDLNYLFEEMLGNINVGHMFIRGGARPDIPKVKVGLLGADYKLENGRWRFAKIYDGENWNPDLQAPLTQPGVNVVVGDYLLAVNGRDLRANVSVDSLFLESAGKQTVLRVGPNPDGSGARDVTVVPVDNEDHLRHLAWIEGNRRKVDQLSGGKLAYVHLPDTANGGYTSFNRYFFAQIGKQGVVLDERYNHGGDIADYIIQYLDRHPMARIATREGEDVTDPTQAIYGPKVMIINQFAGSGGDAMPWYFRKAGLGPLVGTKTWGGLVGIGNYPPLIDGGSVTAPRWAFYGLNGEWEVENHGIAPDIEVEQDPKLVREGHDPQLERAVKVALELLEKDPPKTYKRPAYPDYHPKLPTGEAAQ